MLISSFVIIFIIKEQDKNTNEYDLNKYISIIRVILIVMVFWIYLDKTLFLFSYNVINALNIKRYNTVFNLNKLSSTNKVNELNINSNKSNYCNKINLTSFDDKAIIKDNMPISLKKSLQNVNKNNDNIHDESKYDILNLQKNNSISTNVNKLYNFNQINHDRYSDDNSNKYVIYRIDKQLEKFYLNTNNNDIINNNNINTIINIKDNLNNKSNLQEESYNGPELSKESFMASNNNSILSSKDKGNLFKNDVCL